MGSMSVLSLVYDTYDWSHFNSYELVLFGFVLNSYLIVLKI